MLQIFGKSFRKAKRILRIGFVTADPDTAPKLQSSFPEHQGIDIKVIDSSSVRAGAGNPDVGVYLYDLDITTETSMAEFDRFMHARPPAIPVIVLAPAVDEELVRWFLRLRVADWLKLPIATGELIAACGRAVSQNPTGKSDVQCTTIVNARGGAGATTMAIHAALIAVRKPQSAAATILVDLNLSDGCCAEYLDLQPGWQIEELILNPDRLDRQMMDIMTTRHKSGIDVLAAQRSYFAPALPVEEAVTNVLDLATQTHQQIVIDLPRQVERWTESVLIGSSQVFVVTDFSIPGLKSAKRLATEMLQQFGGEVKPKIIVNKYTRSFFGAALSGHEVKKVLGDLLAGYVPADESLMREAVDRGIPSTDIKPKNALITELAKILEAP